MADKAIAKCSDGVMLSENSLKLNKMDSQSSNQTYNQQASSSSSSSPATKVQVDCLKLLYPNVNEEDSPLPRAWSPQEKCNSIGLSQNNLRVIYKGVGKSHNDAASVRTAYPIPAACGLYYFEVKIISKGRDGYMGIGLTAQNFKVNRLPGWDKQSYGYHGDDGNSFCSSGNGQPYGPTFTTNDIIGCGVNLVDNTCFYTKNGHHLGIAFRELPSKLYPTVGLQTPGEMVDANFGQEPFKFDIEDMLKELRASTKASIYNFPLPDDQGDWTAILNKMVSSYLVHHGYSSTAETFSKVTGTHFSEDLSSVKNRQKILKLVMSGRMGQAIEHTMRSYPGLLENNQNLMFMLKCRQFIEMVNGSDLETANTCRTSPIQTSVIQSTKAYQNGNSTVILDAANGDNQELKNNSIISNTNSNSTNNIESLGDCSSKEQVLHNQINQLMHDGEFLNDVEMENGHITNGNGFKNGSTETMSNSLAPDVDEDMEVDPLPNRKSTKSGVERMLDFGRELYQLSLRLENEGGANETNTKMLEDAFSLLAYSNPWASPLGWQLCPSKRESVCAALNSAILESMNYSWLSSMEICVAHAFELLRQMATSSLGACAFASVDDILKEH